MKSSSLNVHSILLLLSITGFLCHGAIADNAIKKTADKTDFPIGLTLEQYETALKRREKETETRFVKAHANDRPHLETQLYTIQDRLQNIKQSYRTHTEDLQKRITQLESIRGQVPDELLHQTQQALGKGDNRQVEQLLQQLEKQSAGARGVTAEASYQRCQIARDEIRYRQASTLCQQAVQQAPGRTDYLSDLADLAAILGEHEKAVAYYEQVLAGSIEAHGEDHPDVAISRNNLGTAWDALGEYEKAIGYYEQALASDIKIYGEKHPGVAVDRNNLGMAWYALGEYNNAIAYFEQALASDIETYGEDHLQIATYRNNLAGAWYALGEYKTAHDYLVQALQGFEKILGKNHPNTNGVRANFRQLQSDMQTHADVSKKPQ